MKLVFLTALGVGGATILGSIIGFAFKNITHKFSDLVLSFAAGVMLAAAILGLVLPSVEYGNLIITVAGIFTGAFSLNLIDRMVPHMHHLVGADTESHKGNANLDKVLLFVMAIAINHINGAFGSIDVLVNNAGLASSSPLEETTMEKWNLNIGRDMSLRN